MRRARPGRADRRHGDAAPRKPVHVDLLILDDFGLHDFTA
jgi:DNA replication protein DnaC